MDRRLAVVPRAGLVKLEVLDRRLRAEGKRAIAWDYRNLYFSWPFISAGGAYSIGKHQGLYDLADLGIDTPAAIAGVEGIKQLLDSGVLPRDSDYAGMMAAFKRGELAMMINGPWAWNELRAAGIDIALASIPGPGADRPGRPFVGIQAAALNHHSPNQEAARRFLEDYLSSPADLRQIDQDKPLGVPANLELMQEAQRDPLIQASFDAAMAGEIMPDIPEMKRFWGLFNGRFDAMLQGARRLHYPMQGQAVN
ncbi:extracellular solute-binding protein [Pseudomonas benzenivorans]|uniref:Maltodextrin-binding protein n=1 Tax=Pseudomonas benzenivorans TaxID=556533 RepID=A0ABY5H6W0_9PSED|nr:extracellular solute-binding protein [Pseudomonas benzenivorans]UTW08053.1 extracellular solute-binding protein [Pseudomonas benzenivorans]